MPTNAHETAMKIIVAPDKFKGTFSAAEAALTIAEGIRLACDATSYSDMDIVMKPMADGGEGSLEILAGEEGHIINAATFDALMRPTASPYAVMPDRHAAVIEAASSIGLYKIARHERNPLRTTSFGFGTAIRSAIEAGCNDITVTIGGSATSDCGVGMLAAMGCLFYDTDGTSIPHPCGADLPSIIRIDPTPLHNLTRGVRFRILSDVDNPLLGPEGAAAVFAPQKGADADTVTLLENGATSFSATATAVTGRDFRSAAGSGAAGGIGWALRTFCDAQLTPGAPYIAEYIGLEEAMKGAALVITGEGRFDTQSLHGKTAGYVASLARRHGIPAMVMCGARELDIPSDILAEAGITAVCATTDNAPHPSAFTRSKEALRQMTCDAFRYLLAQ